MTDREEVRPAQDTLMREAHDWVMRLTSGNATTEDVEALHRWRQTSRAHRQAFAEANMLWDKLGPAAAESVRRAQAGEPALREARKPVSRRAFVGGALTTAAAAGVGYVVVQPPLGLWPSLTEMTADYRTGAGQQQQIALDERVSLKLNTRTSISLLPSDPSDVRADRIELVAGEAAIRTADQNVRPLIVVAAQGETIAQAARFNIRHDAASVCVTCLDGTLEVRHLGRSVVARADQQIIYTASTMTAAVEVDPDTVTAWERGLLVFRNDPLARVVEEVNRYRAGKIILMRAELGERPVLATFRIDRIDEVVPRLQAVFGVEITRLPGGIVLVS